MGRDRADHHRRTHFARNRGLGLRLWLRGHDRPTYKPCQFRIDSRSRLCLQPSLRQIPAQEQVFLLRSGDLQCDRPVVAAPLRVHVALSRLSRSGWRMASLILSSGNLIVPDPSYSLLATSIPTGVRTDQDFLIRIRRSSLFTDSRSNLSGSNSPPTHSSTSSCPQ